MMTREQIEALVPIYDDDRVPIYSLAEGNLLRDTALALYDRAEKAEADAEQSAKHVVRLMSAGMCPTHTEEVQRESLTDFMVREIETGCHRCLQAERDTLRVEVASITDAINTEARECHVQEADKPDREEIKAVVRRIVDALRAERDALKADIERQHQDWERAANKIRDLHDEIDKLKNALSKDEAPK